MAYEIVPQPAQAGVDRTTLAATIKEGLGFSLAALKHGQLVVLAGVAPRHPGVGVAWAVLSSDLTAREFLTIHRATDRAMKASVFDRIEAYASMDHEPSIRWLEILQFKCEGVMRKFHNGKDFALFAKVK